MQRGIYSIVNSINGNQYIGSASSFIKRKSIHFKDLERNKHQNQHLQRAYNKYGVKAFEFKVLENIEDQELLIPQEQYWIDRAKGLNIDLYNIAQKAGSNLGLIPSAEIREKIGNAHRGIPRSQEIKDKIRKALMGHGVSKETRKRISKAGYKGICKNGHNLEEVGRSKTGQCSICYGERRRQYSISNSKRFYYKNLEKTRKYRREWAKKDREMKKVIYG